MPVIERPGAVVNFEVWGEGEGPWVTLVNGHTRPLNDFRLLGRHLVGFGFRVVALDNRGAGLTTVTRDFKFSELVGDVAALWDEVGCETSRLAGISMGGFIAQTLAMDHAERVEKLALISTSMNQRRIVSDDKPWTSDLGAVEAKLLPYFTTDFASRNALLVKSMVKQIAKAVTDGRFSENSEMQRRAVAGFDGMPRITAGELRAPTLVLHGAEDQIIPAEAARETYAALRKSGMMESALKLQLLPGAGHLLLAERPKDLYQAVAEWFAV